MTTTRRESVETDGGSIPADIEIRGNVTDSDIEHLLASLARVVRDGARSMHSFDVLLTVRHDRDAGAQARVRLTSTTDGEPLETEVYAGALRNAISEVEARLIETGD